jgi:hypothetical protein
MLLDGNLTSHGFFYNTTAAYTFAADPNVPHFVFSQILGINDHDIASVITATPAPANSGSSTTWPPRPI